MALRKPSTKRIGVKVLVTGQTGAGKSLFGLSFPKIAALDSEAGLALYEGNELGKNIEVIDNTMSVADMEETFDEVESMLDDSPDSIRTLLIDSETKFYQNLQHSCLETEEKRARKKGGDINDTNLSVRSWGRIKQVSSRLQNMKIDLSAKGVNIISVSQVDDVKQKVGEQFVKIGEKPVMPKNAEYDYDIIINLFIENDDKGNQVYRGEIKKDRTNVTKIGDMIENPSYSIWSDYLEGRKSADMINSKLTKDVDRDIVALEKEDSEKENVTEGVDVAKNIELIKEIKVLYGKASEEAKKESTTYMSDKGVSLKEYETVNTEVFVQVVKILS
ncbi:AAA family ATPase [Psychrobacillus phage Perkons]|nr:AAA family ATPase [Psychrobacillus phage Perkons]